MTVRTIPQLIGSAMAIIDQGFRVGANSMLPLFSGGHDSLCVCHLVSTHPRFVGTIHHIDTGIGAKAARAFVNEVCDDSDWKLRVYKSKTSYEKIVRIKGFPGPGMHKWTYIRLKDHCIQMMTKGRGRVSLITGARQQESTRRMGHVVPIQIGELSKKTGEYVRRNRCWLAPCYDWSVDEQRAYMDHFNLPRNPLKDRLGMSGECFCGCFATPGEMEIIRYHAPDVADEIDRLTAIAKECGTHDEWGTRPDGRKGVVVAETGPLCTSCDIRARFAGITLKDS